MPRTIAQFALLRYQLRMPPSHPPTSGKRYPLNMRTTLEIRNKLAEAAEASGRSLAQEVERRLERSFEYDDLNERLLTLERKKRAKDKTA